MRNKKVLPPFKSYGQPQGFFVDKQTNRQMGQKLSTGNPPIYRCGYGGGLKRSRTLLKMPLMLTCPCYIGGPYDYKTFSCLKKISSVIGNVQLQNVKVFAEDDTGDAAAAPTILCFFSL